MEFVVCRYSFCSAVRLRIMTMLVVLYPGLDVIMLNIMGYAKGGENY